LVSRREGRTHFYDSFIKGRWKEYVNTEDETTRNFKTQHNEEFLSLFASKYCNYPRR